MKNLPVKYKLIIIVLFIMVMVGACNPPAKTHKSSTTTVHASLADQIKDNNGGHSLYDVRCDRYTCFASVKPEGILSNARKELNQRAGDIFDDVFKHTRVKSLHLALFETSENAMGKSSKTRALDVMVSRSSWHLLNWDNVQYYHDEQLDTAIRTVSSIYAAHIKL